MKVPIQWVGGVAVLASMLFAVIYLQKPSSPSNLPPPTSGRTIIHFGEEGENRDRREAWFELMHRAAPGVDWRALEYQNRLERHRGRRAGMEFRNDDCEIQVLANGKLKGRWQERGSVNQAGSVFDTEYDPEAGLIWLVSAGGTIFNSDRLGLSWNVVNQDLEFNPGLLKFIPRDNGRRLLAFAGRIPHYSDDDGLSWMPATGIVHNDAWGNFHKPVVLDDDQHSFFVFAKPSYWDNIKLYRSGNGGEHFTSVKTYPTHEFDRLTICKPHHSNDLFLLEKASDGSGRLYKVSLAGGQMEWLNQGAELNYGGAPANLSAWAGDGVVRLYTYVEEGGVLKVFQSDNLGQTWAFRGNLPAWPWSVGMYVLPSNPDVLLMGEVECFRSLDAGQNWERVNHWWEYYGDIEGKLHADLMHFAEFETIEGTPFLLVSNHGGLTLSEDYLQSQSNIGLHGLNVSQYYSVRTDPLDPNFVYGGSQDQGFQLSAFFEDGQDGPELFEQIISGDYGHIVFSNNRQSLWTVYPGGWVTYYQNAQSGSLTASYDLVSENESVWLPPLMASPFPEENAVYMAGGNVNGGPGSYIIRLEVQGNQIQASQFGFDFRQESGGGEVSAMAVAPGYPEKWYTATTNGRVFYSDDGGQNWEQALNFVPSGHYLYGQALYASKYDPQTVYLAGSGYSNPAVYRSTDGGEHFISVSAGLPPTLVFGLAANEDESLLFAATEAGPYVYVVEEGQWFYMSGGCAPAQTYWSVEYVEPTKTVRFGTYGRGIWDFALDEEVTVNKPSGREVGLTVFPNPSAELVNLRIDGDVSGTRRVIVFNAGGQMVMEQSFAGNLYQLDLQRMPKGVYFLEVRTDKKRLVQRLVVN